MFTVWRGIALSILLAGHAHAAKHCVILQYHHVDDETPGITSVSPDLFQQHLDYLASNQHVVLPLHEIVAALRTGRRLPERCVGLSIDDAYVSTYREVYPRAAYYALKQAYELDPYAPSTDLAAINEHWMKITPGACVLQARGDTAALARALHAWHGGRATWVTMSSTNFCMERISP